MLLASAGSDSEARSLELMATISTPWSMSVVEITMASGPIRVRISFKASAELGAVNFWGPMALLQIGWLGLF